MQLKNKVVMGHVAKTIVALGFLTASGSAFAADKADRTPVNCATAEGNLRAIAAEKKHAQDQQLESVAAITPAGALLGLVTGTENKRLKMLSGDYVKQLDERTAEIKATCNIK